ncbi:MAG TPA: response regulator [Candidatus Angelobacter sp.]|nr:response regulator [Candidatus Angelobacter sp.]
MFQRPRLLIVDDEPNVCFTLKLIFEQEGFTVECAGSAAEGIKVLSQHQNNGHHFDMVLTDLHMEKEDIGLELARAAKKLDPQPLLIILTGYASMKNARAALDIHVDHFALKPIELTDLLENIRRLIGWRTDAQGVGD